MKLRSFFSFLVVGVFALLALSAGGFYWLTTQTPLNLLNGGPTTTPAAAVFVSKQAPLLVSMLVNPDRIEALRQVFATPAERSRSHAEFEQIKKSLLANTNLDYSRDIQPWVGDEITFAITTPDIDRDRNNGQQTGFLLALSSQNADRSQQFLDSYWKKQSANTKAVQFEQYKGVKLTYKKLPPTINQKSQSISPLNRLNLPNSNLSSNFATALIGDSLDLKNNHNFVLFANDPKVLRDAIDNLEVANLNLNNSPEYQKALQQLTQGRIALGFLNIPQPETEKNPQLSLNSLGVAVGVNRRGLVAQTALVTSPENTTIPKLSEPVQALKYIPSASPFVVASTDLSNFWTQLSSTVGTNPEVSKLADRTLADIQTAWGINLPQDIFNWVKGEYALAVLPGTSNSDWIFAAETSADSQKAIARLDEIARSKEYSIGSFTLRNQKITAWTQLTTNPNYGNENKGKSAIKTEAKGVRATVGKYEIFTTSVEAMDEALKAAETGSLIANQDFQTSIEPLPTSNDGYFYLDWPSSRGIWEKQIPLLRLIELSARPLFDHLRSLTITSTGETAGIRKATIFMRLN